MSIYIYIELVYYNCEVKIVYVLCEDINIYIYIYIRFCLKLGYLQQHPVSIENIPYRVREGHVSHYRVGELIKGVNTTFT